MTSRVNNKTHKPFLNGLSDTEFFKEANKTMISTNKSNAHPAHRGASHSRWKQSDLKCQTSKSVGRHKSHKSTSRPKCALNSHGTRNARLSNVEAKTVTKRVGGGYSSFAMKNANQHCQSANSNNVPKAVKKEKVKIRYLPSSKRKS